MCRQKAELTSYPAESCQRTSLRNVRSQESLIWKQGPYEFLCISMKRKRTEPRVVMEMNPAIIQMRRVEHVPRWKTLPFRYGPTQMDRTKCYRTLLANTLWDMPRIPFFGLNVFGIWST